MSMATAASLTLPAMWGFLVSSLWTGGRGRRGGREKEREGERERGREGGKEVRKKDTVRWPRHRINMKGREKKK